MHGFFQLLRLGRNALDAAQHVHPVNDGAGGPLVGGDGDALQHGGPCGAVAREGFDGGELEHVQVFAGRPVAARDAAFDEGGQAVQHGLAHVFRQGVLRLDAAGFVGGGQHPRGEDGAAFVFLAAARREVVEQAVAVHVGGHLRCHAAPLRFIAHADGLAGLLLQAGVGVVGKPVVDGGQAIGQLRLQGQAQPATARQGVGGRGHGQGIRRFKLHEGGLLHRHGHGGHDALADFQGVAGAAVFILGADFPGDFLRAGHAHVRRGGDLPAGFARLAGGYFQRLRFGLQRGGFGPHLHFHGLVRGVAQGEGGFVRIAAAHQGRQAADDLQILRDAHAGFAGAKAVGAAVGHDHDLEGGERVIERHIHDGLAVGVQLHVRLPQKQGVEQLAHGRAARAVAARGRGLAAVVAAAHDFHLRGGRFHVPGAAPEHGFQQVPAGVGHEFKQRLVHGGHGHPGLGGGLAAGQLGLNAHAGRAARGVAGLVGFHAHVHAVVLLAHADFGHAEAVGGLAQVHQRGGRGEVAVFVAEGSPPLDGAFEAPGEKAVPGHFIQPPAQRQHAHVNVRPPVFTDFQADGGVVAAELHHLRLHDAFALHGHQRGGLAEGHSHLKASGVTRVVAFLLRQHVHAVVVFAVKPQFALACDPHALRGLGLAARFVSRAGHQFDAAGLRQLHIAVQQAARVGLAAAQRAQVMRFVVVVVGIEAAYQPLARGGGGVRHGAHGHGRARLGLALQIERQRLQFQVFVHGNPAVGAQAGHHGSGPQGLRPAQGLGFAIGVGIGGFQQQLARAAGGGQLGEHQAPRALRVQRERLLVGHELLAGGAGRIAVIVHAGFAAAAPVGRGEAEAVVVAKVRRNVLDGRRHLHGQVRRRAASHVAHLHLHGHVCGGDQGVFIGHGHAAAIHGQAELFHAEGAGGMAATVVIIAAACAKRDAVHAQLGVFGHGELAGGAAAARGGVAPVQLLRVFLPAAHVGDGQRARHAACGRQRQRAFFGADGLAQVVLHRHRFARAHERAVQHGVRHFGGRAAVAARGRVEAPGFNAPVPVAPDKSHVLPAAFAAARADEVAARAFGHAPFMRAGAGLSDFRQARQALRVGHGPRHGLAVAVRHVHLRARHGLAVIERGHPGQRAFRTPLEMHGQVGHQRRGAHIHGALRPVAFVQQGLAQLARGDFQHVKAGSQRNAHHLERPRVALLRAGQRLRLRVRAAFQQRDGPRFHIVLRIWRILQRRR